MMECWRPWGAAERARVRPFAAPSRLLAGDRPMNRLIVMLVAVATVGLVSFALAQGKTEKLSVKTLPPVVVRTTPQAGDTQVDAAAVKEIRVTYSKDMTDNSWSWSQMGEDTYPKMDGKPHYEADKRTCVMPVKLEAGRTYVVLLNSEKFTNFKDADGRPALPYLLVFETK
jgi:hypothetical protein